MNRKERRRYFKLHVKNQKTAVGYLTALRESPHKEHREQAVKLAKQYNALIGEAIEDTKEI